MPIRPPPEDPLTELPRQRCGTLAWKLQPKRNGTRFTLRCGCTCYLMQEIHGIYRRPTPTMRAAFELFAQDHGPLPELPGMSDDDWKVWRGLGAVARRTLHTLHILTVVPGHSTPGGIGAALRDVVIYQVPAAALSDGDAEGAADRTGLNAALDRLVVAALAAWQDYDRRRWVPTPAGIALIAAATTAQMLDLPDPPQPKAAKPARTRPAKPSAQGWLL